LKARRIAILFHETDREMDEAIGDLLGYLPEPGVRIRWELAHIRADKT